jgi:type I restriction enzyme S subunit
LKGDWEVKKLGEVVDIGRGKSKHTDQRDAEFLFGGKYPFIQTGDVRKADLYSLSLHKFSIQKQDYSKANYGMKTLCALLLLQILLKLLFLKSKACFPDSIIGLIPKENKQLSFL